MALDRYAFCPGGTGKKIKFCCADMTAELEQIQRTLQGEQRLAALERVRKTRAQLGDRACLLAIECLLEDELEQLGQHADTLRVFAEKFPGNPVVLAEKALSLCDAEGPQAAVAPLQEAIAMATEHFPARVFEAIGIIGRLLVGNGFIMAGRAHLMFEAALTGGEAPATLSLLARIGRADDVPLLLKDDYRLEPPPPGMAARSEFEEALQLGQRGAWLASAARFEKLAPAAGNAPSLWRNVGVLKAFCADNAGAAAALRRFSGTAASAADAVEAEALAQLLTAEDAANLLDVAAVTWNLPDAADAQTRLGADRRATRVHFDPAAMAGTDEPPPLALFRLADRPPPENADDVTRENVSSVLGQVAIFGRQTDREARLEVIATRGAELEAATHVLADILGKPLGPADDEDVVRQVPALTQAMTWRWQLPADMTPQRRLELSRQQHRHVLLDVWPSQANPALGGRTPREAAADSGSQVALAAAVLNLELTSSRTADDEIFVELRRQLGLPASALIDPTGLDVHRVPAPRLARLDVAKLTNEALVGAFRRAAWLHFVPAIVRLAHELIHRPGLEAAPLNVDMADVYGLLAEVSEEQADRLRYIDAARTVAEKRGGSSAPWDLSELAVAMEYGDNEAFQRLLTHINEEHLREPGIGEALMSLLGRAGLIGPATPEGMAVAVGDPALAGAAAPSASAAPQIWTPGGQTAPAAGGKKPAIWTPGS